MNLADVSKLNVIELKQKRAELHKLLAESDSHSDRDPEIKRVVLGIEQELEAVSNELRKKENQLNKEAEAARAALNGDSSNAQWLGDTKMNGKPGRIPYDPRFDSEARQTSFFDYVALNAGLPGRDVGRAREVSQEAARRAGRSFQGIAVPGQVFDRRVSREWRQDPMTTTLPLAGPGSNWVGTDHLDREFINALYGRLVLQRLGTRLITGLVGNVDIPKLAASAEAQWFADNSAITLSDATAAKIEATPKLLGSRSEVSRLMVLQARPEVERIYADDFLNLHRRAIDRAAIAASTVNGPTGILGSGLDLTTSFATPSWANVLTLIELVENADAEGNAFLTRPSVVRTLRSTVKVGSTDSAMIQESPNELAGFPLASSTLVPADTLIFGMFSDVLILVWESFDLLTNPYADDSYSKGNIQIRMISAVDVAVRHSESFAGSEDVDTGATS